MLIVRQLSNFIPLTINQLTTMYYITVPHQFPAIEHEPTAAEREDAHSVIEMATKADVEWYAQNYKGHQQSRVQALAEIILEREFSEAQ